MERLMNKDELIKYVYDTYGIGSGQATNKECFDIICHIYDAPTVEAIPKADYENRLKVDMVNIIVDILEELKSEIKEIKPLEPTDDEDWQYGCFHGLELMQDKCLRLVQEKINKLKENE